MKRMNMQHMMRACLCAVLLILGAGILQVSAQGVGINTTTPDPSAALDIQSTNKGILIPQVQLQSLIDQFTIPAPAHGLLVYHAGNNLGGKGFFYNSGLFNGPVWKRVGELTYPYYHGGSEDILVNLENYKQNSTAIRAYSISGPALDVEGGLKIAGPGQSPGLGKVLTSDAQGNAKWEGAVAFKASEIKMGGSEKVASAVAKVPFASEQYDLSGNYNDLTGSPHSTFIAPVTGLYHFDALLNWGQIDEHESSDFTSISIVIKSGNLDYPSIQNQVFADARTASASTDVHLYAGDQVSVSFSHSVFGGYIYLTKGWFSGRMILAE